MKKNIVLALSFAFLAAGSALADGLTQPHPGYIFTDIQPAGARYLAAGLATYSNGDLAVCNWGNPGDVYVLKNPRAGGQGAHSARRFAYGLQQVMGCRVVRDTLYVMQMGELTALVDVDKDGQADEYLKVNDNFSTSESLLAYAFDLEYLHGNFWITLSSDVMRGGMDANPSLKDRSTFMRLGRDNSSEILSSGFRNPNGMTLGFGNRLFAVDNQGSWTPLSKIIHLQKGRFYGHHNHTAAPFENQAETWPMLWLPRGTVDYQPGGLAFFKEGIFKGQLLFAQPDKRLPGRVYRVYAEDVGGVMQGGIVAFSGGLGGAMRVHIDANNVIYVGNLNSNGGWDKLPNMDPGLKRLVPKDVNAVHAFEILRVRVIGNGTVEVDFTKPVGPGGAAPGSYTGTAWTVTPVVGYGENSSVNNHALTVTSASLKNGNKTVELKISGMQLRYIHNLKMGAVKSAEGGETLWGQETWFTVNAWGPGVVPEIAPCREPNAYTGASFAFDCDPSSVGVISGPGPRTGLQKTVGGKVALVLPYGQDYTVRLFDMRGGERKVWTGSGMAEIDPFAGNLSPGLYLMVLQAGAYSGALKVIRP